MAVLWLVANGPRLVSDEDAAIRMVLGGAFALAILFRRKPSGATSSAPTRHLAVLAVISAFAAIAGVVFGVHQFEWLGLILLAYCGLRWALPASFGRDIATALFLLYWVHPLPGRVFGGLQMLMQVLSVKGSETVLHAANHRIWADGLVLRSGFQGFGVPESCSGMRTGITVLLTILGVCFVFRMRWYEMLAFLAAGLAQVMAMNVIRIVFMVYWAPRMAPEWAQGFLHDTLGLLLLVSILLVQVEIVMWRGWIHRRRDSLARIAAGITERPDRAVRLPKFWQRLIKWGWVVVLAVLAAAAAAGIVRGTRTSHRAEMIAGVVDDLMQYDPSLARRAAEKVLTMKPGDREMLSRRIQAMVLRGQFREALAQLDAMKPPFSVFETVLRSWSLMAIGMSDEAIRLVDSLPQETRSLPGVAIVRAEYAAMRDQPEVVSENVLLAAHTHVPINRIRALFPYLASHEQWDAIVAADDVRARYATFPQSLISVHAGLRTRNTVHAALAIRQGLLQWPDDPRFLGSLFLLASVRPGGEWEDRFARQFRANVAALDEDTLATYLNYCFKLDRPDLAWLAYLRLRKSDPKDPALLLAPAQYAEIWFAFRRKLVSMVGRDQESQADLRTICLLTRRMRPFSLLWDAVPICDEIAATAPEAVRSKYAKACLAELAARESAGPLSLRMEMIYPTALSLEDRYKEAHARLDSIVERYPVMKEEALFQHAVFYDQEARWQDAYEALARYRSEIRLPNMAAELLMVNALMNLDMGVPAMEVVRDGARDFPGAVSLAVAEAAIWDVFGHKAQALHVLRSSGAEWETRAVPQLLYDTGRIREAEQLANGMGIRLMVPPVPPKQALLPLPAELVFNPVWPRGLTAEEMDREAERVRSWLPKARSPFLERLSRLMLRYYEERGSPASADPAQWEEGFSTDLEATAALHRLAMLSARQGETNVALAAARMALGRRPRSAILWRVRIGLGDSSAEVLAEAAANAADDPDVWLANLVAGVRAEKGADWAAAEAARAVAARLYSSETMTRAGDFLFRSGMLQGAAIAARDAIERARGYLPALVLGYKCALSQRDHDWALMCALRGVEYANDPSPFYKAVVLVKTIRNKPDADLVSALEYLKDQSPEESRWAEQLAWIYFQKGDLRRSLNVLGPIISRNLRGIRVQSLLIAAEAARLEGVRDRALGILETAHSMYPERVSILNNLIYNLAQDDTTVRRARELLPGLLEIGGGSYAILDTAAIVYLRSGQLERARDFMRRALDAVREGDYGSLEVKLNAAEILLRSGELSAARDQVESVRRDRSRTAVMDIRARELLGEIETAGRTP